MSDTHFPETYKTKSNKCPVCKELLDAATNMENLDSPKSGDFSICFYCGVWLRFNADLTLRVVVDEDLVASTHDQIRKLSIVSDYIGRRNSGKAQGTKNTG